MKYRLNEPYIKGKEKEYVNDVIDSGWLSVNGKHTKEFERQFAEMVGVKYAMAVQSGTAALHTALLALGIKEKSRVAVPNYTCAANVSTILQCNAIPRILDIEKDTFGLDADGLEKLIEKEYIDAAMLVHVYGFPARDTERIVDICKKNNVLLLEDAAEAHGAEYKGKKCGSFGDMSIFSVRSEKMIGVGEGGLVLSDNKSLMDKAYYWAARAAPKRGNNYPYWYQYYYSGVGMNYLMPHILGAIGRGQIENFPEILKRKRAVGEKYHSLLKNIEGIETQKKIPESNPSYWLNIALMKDKSESEVRDIGLKMMDKGIEIRPAFWPLDNQEVFKPYACTEGKNAKYLFEKGLILPSSVYLDEKSIDFIVKEFRGIYGK